MNYNGMGPEWFPVVLGTLGLSVAVYVLYLVFDYYILFLIGKIIFYIVIIFYLFVLSSWIYRYAKNTRLIKSDFNNITTLSFTAFPGVLYFALAFFYYAYIGFNAEIAYLFLYLYIFFYIFVFIINIILNYNLYTNKYKFSDITYAILVPTVALGANIILSSILLIRPLSLYYTSGILTLLYFMVIIALGITFFQFLFIGTASFISHIGNSNYNVRPATMIPVGSSSMLIINIAFLPLFNYLKLFNVPKNIAVDISMPFFGFDLLSFSVAAVIAIMHVKKRQAMTVWAYVFPLGVATFAYYMLYDLTEIYAFVYVIMVFTVALFTFYTYAWINTHKILKHKK